MGEQPAESTKCPHERPWCDVPCAACELNALVKDPVMLVRHAARLLATRTSKQIEALAESESEADDLETDITCSMLYAAREAVDMRRVR